MLSQRQTDSALSLFRPSVFISCVGVCVQLCLTASGFVLSSLRRLQRWGDRRRGAVGGHNKCALSLKGPQFSSLGSEYCLHFIELGDYSPPQVTYTKKESKGSFVIF